MILQQAERLRALQQQLAVQRMRKYELKHEALSDEELKNIHDDIVSKNATTSGGTTMIGAKIYLALYKGKKTGKTRTHFWHV